MYNQRVVRDRIGVSLKRIPTPEKQLAYAVTALCYRSTDLAVNVRINFQLLGSVLVNGDVADIDDGTLKTASRPKSVGLI